MRKLIFIVILFASMVVYGQGAHQAETTISNNNSSIGSNCYVKAFIATPPPGGKVRSIAEFEPSEGVIIGYPGNFGVPFSLIAQLSNIVKVYTLVAGQTQENTVRNLYSNNGVNLNNCIFVHGPLDTYWTRDYSPWFIADSAHNVAIVDFPYNRPRPNDNVVPGRMATELGLQIYGMNLVQTGGNYMCDGLGTAASTKLVNSENTNYTAIMIGDYMRDYLGIEDYDTIEDPLGDYIQHIDCWGKYLAPDKIFIAEVPSNDPRYTDYEAVAAYFASKTTPYGYPYKVYRTYSPNGQPYSNSLIINNTVFVPFVNSGGNPWNDSAKAVFQRAMPGYNIQGIPSNGWYETDALHCRTHEIADRGMLYIRHFPLWGNVPQSASYEIKAELISYSKSLIYNDSALVYYRYDSGPWRYVNMTPDTGFVWKGVIPDTAVGVTIQYALHAADTSGRNENHPYIGVADPHSFKVVPSTFIDKPQVGNRQIIVFPNPADNVVYAAIMGCAEKEVKVRILDYTGALVRNHFFACANDLYSAGISVSHLKSGVYLMEAECDGKRFIKKFYVVH